MSSKQIGGCISYLEDMWRHAMMLGEISPEVLLRLSIKFLTELKEIYEKKEGK